MSVIAKFQTKIGNKIWQVHPSIIKDLDGFSTSYELKAESNTAIEGSPLNNTRGLKPKELSFYSRIIDVLGVNVRKEIEGWESFVGQTGTLKIGGKQFGPRWLLTSVKITETIIDNSGRIRSAKLAYTFKENEESTSENITVGNSAANITAATSVKAVKKAPNNAIQYTLGRYTK